LQYNYSCPGKNEPEKVSSSQRGDRRLPLGEAKATQPAAGSGGTEPFKTAVISAQIHAKKRCFVTELPGFPGLLLTNWKMGGCRKKSIRHLV
jgi:hypothetical protein